MAFTQIYFQHGNDFNDPVTYILNLTPTRKFYAISLKTKARKIYMSDRLIECLGNKKTVDFSNKKVLDIIESDIEKSRITRIKCIEKDRILYNGHITNTYPKIFNLLLYETRLSYDSTLYQLKETFAEMIDIDSNSLHLLHQKYSSDKGRKNDRIEKKNILNGVINRKSNIKFQLAYDYFIKTFIAPHINSIMEINVLYYQLFPCIRILRPGEFSIGPHSDISYGFSQANINFYLPLTKIKGNNSIVIESEPNKEDWHFLDADYGDLIRFYGACCNHFSVENTTNETRISFDFRVIPGELFDKNHDHFSQTKGYYSKCIKQSNNEWVSDDILEPDYRVGKQSINISIYNFILLISIIIL
jgi:hypothetical protein